MTFSVSKMIVAASVSAGTFLTANASANAASFGFKFDTKYLGNDSPKGNIILDSVTVGDEIITDFSFVSSALIVDNASGAASADRGDLSTTGVNVEDATADDIVINLSTNNLNNIIDTEDKGNFIIDLSFGKIIDNLLIWERGKNSDLGIQTVDGKGNLIGNRLKVTREMWFDAGFSIDTTEIRSAQKVGSLGINIAQDLGIDAGTISTIRVFSTSKFNGPDWKIVGTDATRHEDVPEPSFLIGLGILGASFVVKKRLPAA
jgi:hypothetical protein